MSRVLTDNQKRETVLAVGSVPGVAQAYWEAWNPEGLNVPAPDVVRQWIGNYAAGIERSIQDKLGRSLLKVSGSEIARDFLHANWRADGLHERLPVVNLARFVYSIVPETRRSTAHPSTFYDVGRDEIMWSETRTVDFSRGRTPELKKSVGRNRGRHAISRGKPLESQLDELGKHYAGQSVMIWDDRGQTGKTLHDICNELIKRGVNPKWIVIGHSEVPRTDFSVLRVGDREIPVYCQNFDFEDKAHKAEWNAGRNGTTIGEEFHDLFSSCPAAGEAVMEGYFDAFPQLKEVYQLLKITFISLSMHASKHGEFSGRHDAEELIPYEDLHKLGLRITHPHIFTDYLRKRANAYAPHVNGNGKD